MDSKYVLLFKTAQAEFRAYEKLPVEMQRSLTPIVELTRGRKSPVAAKNVSDTDLITTPGIYGFNKIIEQTVHFFSDHPGVVLDLTRESTLTSYELMALSASADGYRPWTNFLIGQKAQFKNIIPTIIVNPDVDDDEGTYVSKLEEQANVLFTNFSAVAYRFSVDDPDFDYDLQLIKMIRERHAHKTFYIIFDHEFIRPGTGIVHAIRTTNLVNQVKSIFGNNDKIVILSTSFPKSIGEIGNPDHDVFPIEEINLFDAVRNNVEPHTSLVYGDYGSINPTRNDLGGSGGWRPRIDFPTSLGRTFYYREKRDKIGINPKDGKPIYSSYKNHYSSVARKVVADQSFENDETSWGVQQIQLAKDSKVPSSAPSFWISVRMHIHIRKQLARLGLA